MSAMDYADHTRPSKRRTPPVAVTLALVFDWRSDRREERLAVLREREMELQIARLRAVGGF